MRIQDSEFLTALQLQEQVTGQRGRITARQTLTEEGSRLLSEINGSLGWDI